MLEDGRFDMCESCPDVSIYDGKVIPVCRIDEYRKYGNYLRAKILNKNKITKKIKEKRKTFSFS